VEVVALLSQGRTAAAHCGLFTYKSVPVIFEPPCTSNFIHGLDSRTNKGNAAVHVIKNGQNI